MELRSLGCRTDVMIRRLGGSVVEEHPDHLTVMTPSNPTFWWGNFIVIPGPIEPGDGRRWIEVFDEELPEAEHVAVAIDEANRKIGDLVDLGEFIAAGLLAEYATVLTAATLLPPPRPNAEAECRPLRTEGEWEQALDLAMACNDSIPPDHYLPYATRSLAEARRMSELGHGAWFGAFHDSELAASCGIFTDGGPDARFQRVETRPAARRQGLAGTLVHAAGEHAVASLGAQRLVIVADPESSAAGLYRSLGFTDVESQLQLIRRPS